jgi:hypothetical protein
MERALKYSAADILKSMRPCSLRWMATLVYPTLLLIGGCRGGNSFNLSQQSASWTESKQSARQELSVISPPSKSVYLAIDQESQWQNPFLTVESNMIQIRIYLADENSSEVDRGGLTRLSAARKHILNIRLKDLPRALVALPNGAWPYGRVVAVSKEFGPPKDRALISNNFAVTVSAIKDMGVVVDDWTDRSRMH